MTTYETNLLKNGSILIAENPIRAEDLIKKGLILDPMIAEGYYNLGIAMHENKKVESAIRSYEMANKLNGKPIKEAINNLAQDNLLLGNWEIGLKLYENRLNRMSNYFEIYTKMYGKPWQGKQETRKCNKLIVVAEQGLGDTLQYCRFMHELQARNINAILFCQEILIKFLRNSRSIGEITTTLNKQEKDTLWCPLMSLPYILSIKKSEISYTDAYLEPNKEYYKKWGKILRRKEGKKLVALHWQGNPKFEQKIYSKGRSMPFNELKRIGNMNNIEYLSIQKGEDKIKLINDCELNIVEGQKEFDQTMSFDDTAGALANCDLLISADSSVVHLAGAMNIPVWVTLSWVPEWRWGLNGESTEWYTSAKLFRQTRKNNWSNVIQDIKNNLAKL